jgi:hypothetical protein
MRARARTHAHYCEFLSVAQYLKHQSQNYSNKVVIFVKKK